MSLETFKRSATGSKLAPLFSSEETVERMIRKSEAGRPAVEAIGADVQRLVGSLEDHEKKLVGRWAKEVLEHEGWTPDRKGRVATGHFFNRGTIYRRQGSSSRLLSGAERLAAAQAIVRRFSKPPMSSEELIAERRQAFLAEE